MIKTAAYQMLRELNDNPGASTHYLAERLGRTQNSTYKVCKRLVESEHLTANNVLTQKGREALAADTRLSTDDIVRRAMSTQANSVFNLGRF